MIIVPPSTKNVLKPEEIWHQRYFRVINFNGSFFPNVSGYQSSSDYTVVRDNCLELPVSWYTYVIIINYTKKYYKNFYCKNV